MWLRLIIKGPPEAAKYAATERGIKIYGGKKNYQHDEYLYFTESNNFDAVVKWQCEHAEAPFPPGTLLWFKRENDE